MKNTALIVVDIQNGFMPGGQLAVEQADQVIPLINTLTKQFNHVVLTQDWHPSDHISFADNHENKQPYDLITLDYGPQILWPRHCVQGSEDAAFHPALNIDIPAVQLIIRKGCHRYIDSYSAFLEADHQTPTGLNGYLKERGIDTVYVVGVATDFCVAWTAKDAAKLGFNTYVIEDATAAIDLNGSLETAWQEMKALGVVRIQSHEILINQ